ncbi:MAG: glycosyltransferase family 2 protein [Sandaracinus sp.]|nr:glycosyltransferase family 2 protein [Sandaracinus sp.]MCB9631623.1 glycosyltransferase family 2 protein [Sandaracinus sp.]
MGKLDEAREWATQHQTQLQRSEHGVGLLACLDVPMQRRGPRPPYLYNLYREALATPDPDAFVAELVRHPQWWFRRRQLAVVAYDALRRRDERQALSFLQAFVGGGYPRLDAGEGSFVNRVEKPAGRKLPSGGGPPVVSVIVAAHNAGETVSASIRSLLGQDLSNLEVLVCDDASTDDTLSKIVEASGRDRRVRVFRSVENQGPYNVRNSLLPHARGDLITFHDADDIAFPERLSTQVDALRRSGASACIAKWFRVNSSGNIVFFPDHSCSRRSLVSLMVSRQILEAIPSFRNAFFGGDLEYFERVLRQFPVVSIRSPLIWGLWESGSLTRQAGSEALETGFRSPLRRAYSELLLRLRRCEISDSRMGEELESLGLLRPHAGVVVVSA